MWTMQWSSVLFTASSSTMFGIAAPSEVGFIQLSSPLQSASVVAFGSVASSTYCHAHCHATRFSHTKNKTFSNPRQLSVVDHDIPEDSTFARTEHLENPLTVQESPLLPKNSSSFSGSTYPPATAITLHRQRLGLPNQYRPIHQLHPALLYLTDLPSSSTSVWSSSSKNRRLQGPVLMSHTPQAHFQCSLAASLRHKSSHADAALRHPHSRKPNLPWPGSPPTAGNNSLSVSFMLRGFKCALLASININFCTCSAWLP